MMLIQPFFYSYVKTTMLNSLGHFAQNRTTNFHTSLRDDVQSFSPRPAKQFNNSIQHRSTLLNSPCYTRLATLLNDVECVLNILEWRRTLPSNFHTTKLYSTVMVDIESTLLRPFGLVLRHSVEKCSTVS